MAIRAKDIYDGRKKSRFHTGVIITVILFLIVAAILIFYGLRSYCVYDENGNATIVLPWSQKAATESPAASPAVSPVASPSESPAESAAPSPSESPAESTTPSPPESPTETPTLGSEAG